VTLHKHNSSRTGSARPAEYTIRFQGGRYRIYDKQQRFRCEFATPEAANAYVAQRSGAPRPSQFATLPEAA
jgi:hypothetical protein